MNNQNERAALEDVLDAFLSSRGEPDSSRIADWIRRYPEYEQELTEFAASWRLMQDMPEAPDAATVPREVLISRGMGVIGRLLAAAPEPAMQSLLAAGRAHGLSPRELARSTGLGDSVLRKLDRRLIRLGSIPREAIERLAEAIGREAETVAEYLRQRPTLAAAAAYRSEQAPQLAEPEDFASAIRSDSSLSDEDRTRWLELARQAPGE